MIEYTLYANTTNAIRDFSHAIKIDSGYTEAWFNMGTCYELLASKINDSINALRHDSASMAENNYQGNQTKESLNNLLTGCQNRIELYRNLSEKKLFKDP